MLLDFELIIKAFVAKTSGGERDFAAFSFISRLEQSKEIERIDMLSKN